MNDAHVGTATLRFDVIRHIQFSLICFLISSALPERREYASFDV